MSSAIVELGTPDMTPELALELVRNRMKAVVFRGASIAHVGIASGFHLKEIGGKLALACTVEWDDAKHDEIKHLLTDAVEPMLFVGNHPLMGAVAP